VALGTAGTAGAEPAARNVPAGDVAGQAPAPGAAIEAPKPASAPISAGPPDIAMWGDSMTQAYGQRMSLQFPSGRQLFNGGVIGESSSQIKSRFLADTTHRNWINVIWSGHNDYLKQGSLANIQEMIAALIQAGNSRFVVLTNCPWANSQYLGGPERAVFELLNTAIRAAFPNNVVDVAAELLAGGNGSAEDNQDAASGLVPRSLRWPGDTIHLNDQGQDLVASRVRQFIVSRGW